MEREIQGHPPVFHGDPLREEGALVYTDFGSDLNTIIENLGFSLEIIPCGIWYLPQKFLIFQMKRNIRDISDTLLKETC